MHARNRDVEKLVSLAEFERMPEEDAYRIELVRGRLVREPRPIPLHGRLLVRLAYLLEKYAERTAGGDVIADAGFVLEEQPPTVRGPDVAFVARDRRPVSGYGAGFWHLGPDLAVEILSPSNRKGEMADKIAQYFAAGTRVVWIVDPQRKTVTVNARDGAQPHVVGIDGTLAGEPVLPGLALPLEELFKL